MGCTSNNSTVAVRSLTKQRTIARYVLSSGCRLKYSNIQYRRLVDCSRLAIFTCMPAVNVRFSSSPAGNGGRHPLRKAFTCTQEQLQRNKEADVNLIREKGDDILCRLSQTNILLQGHTMNKY
jgi:hypothetical protein